MGEFEDLIGEAPKAACVLFWRDDGRILAVSRPDDPNAFALPGGGVDEGEAPIEAATRELKEETGLEGSGLREVFQAMEGDHLTTTFEGDIEGEFGTEETGVIAWVSPTVLVEGPFGEYNKQLFDKLGIEY